MSLHTFDHWWQDGHAYMPRETAESVYAETAQLLAENASLIEALTPSASTKAAYACEFSFTVPDVDEDGEECRRTITVPWTTIKEIMATIKARTELKGNKI